ncbi:MAG TPA: sensor histidine kinase [Ktedonobacteraceae bacterium]|jgi:two-component system sensor histidine kinase DegS
MEMQQGNFFTPGEDRQQGKGTASLTESTQLDTSAVKSIIDQERRRIAYEIHDDVSQRIAHALYKLELIQRLLEQQQVATAYMEVQHAYTYIAKSLHHLRQYILSLRSFDLEDQTLTDALATLLEEYRTQYPAIELLYTCGQYDQRRVPSRLEAAAFRLIQEALNNAYKHAQATRITLTMSANEHELYVEVQDNGRGFLPASIPRYASSHIGLQSLRERVSDAGGHVDIQSEPGQGTCIKASFPLR